MHSPSSSRFGRWSLAILALGCVHAVAGACGSSDAKRAQRAPGEGGAAGQPGELSSGAASGEAATPMSGAGGAPEAGDAGSPSGGQPEPDSAGAAGASGAGGASGDTGAGGDGGVSGCDELATGSRVLLELDAANAERVTKLEWQDSAGVVTAGWRIEGGQLVCGDPLEFFGQAYGAEATLPAPVVAGDRATLEACGYAFDITSAATDCGVVAQFPVTTQYLRYRGARANQVRITRRFGFGEVGAVFGQNILRPYVPRLPASAFSQVIYPNQAGSSVTAVAPGGCPTDCLVATGATWNGRWFANVDPSSGRAFIVLRDPGLTSPANLAVNHDGLSDSNLTSFLLLAPQDGWQAPLTEIEYLCFADLVSWPQAARDAAQLPAGCGP